MTHGLTIGPIRATGSGNGLTILMMQNTTSSCLKAMAIDAATGVAQASIHIPVSKTDLRGEGVFRSAKCFCKGDATAPCAACALARMIDRPAPAFKGPKRALCKDGTGRTITYKRFLHLLRQMLTRCGYQVVDKETRKSVFGSHSCRRGGAQSLARAGFSKRFIALWGRWESECTRLYVEQAELEGASGELGAAMLASAKELASQWAWVKAAKRDA